MAMPLSSTHIAIELISANLTKSCSNQIMNQQALTSAIDALQGPRDITSGFTPVNKSAMIPPPIAVRVPMNSAELIGIPNKSAFSVPITAKSPMTVASNIINNHIGFNKKSPNKAPIIEAITAVVMYLPWTNALMSVFSRMSRIIEPPKPSKIPTSNTPSSGAWRELAKVAPKIAPKATALMSSQSGRAPGVIKVGSKCTVPV